MRTEGLEHYLAAQARGKGVLIITGHLGAWELSSFYHSLMGHPMGMVIRSLDNRRLDEYVNGIRCLHGNFVISKGRLRPRAAEGHACRRHGRHPDGHEYDAAAGRVCASSSASMPAPGPAWRTSPAKPARPFCRDSCSGSRPSGATCSASVPEVEIPRTADRAADILEGTRRCTAVIESWIRRYPDQWLWIHRRWKTRPPGEPGLY